MPRECLGALSTGAAPDFAVPSREAVSTDDSSAENTADPTAPACPVNVWVHSPVALLQIFAVPSREAVSTDDASAENTADRTAPACPANVWVHSPVSLLQMLAVLTRPVF